MEKRRSQAKLFARLRSWTRLSAIAHVQLPMQTLFSAPMAAGRFGEEVPGEVLRRDAMPKFVAMSAVGILPDADCQPIAYRFQAGPISTQRKILGQI